MSANMLWLTIVLRVTSAPLFVGALLLGLRSERSLAILEACVALVLLGAIQLAYWWRPWPGPKGTPQRRSAVALGAMIPPIALLQQVLPAPQPLLWLYPAIVAGAGLAAPLSAAVVGLMGLAAVFPVPPMDHTSMALVLVLGAPHTLLLSIVLAGLGMVAVRQLVAVNADLQTTKAELAELAVARERERLARDLHDLLGRTLSLIAVKAELANRLVGGREPAAEEEMREVQQLARSALRDAREAITAYRSPTVAAELAAARLALQSAGIDVSVTGADAPVDPSHGATFAWALREAVTNVVKHSRARTCRIALRTAAGVTTLDVTDNGWGPNAGETGSGLRGLADRIHSLGGTLEAGPTEEGGFRVRATLKAGEPVASELETIP